MTTVQPIEAIFKQLLDNGCDPSTLGNLELAIAADLLNREIENRQQNKETMQGAIRGVEEPEPEPEAVFAVIEEED